MLRLHAGLGASLLPSATRQAAMDPAALPAAVCRADADDPRLLGRRSVGEAKVQEKRLPEDCPESHHCGVSFALGI